MGYRGFHEKTPFEEAAESVDYTHAALEAHGDPAVRALAAPLVRTVEEGDALRQRRRDARRARIRASAQVRVADGEEEDQIRELDKDVLAEVRQDREAPLYRAIFRETKSAMIDLSVEPQNEEVARIQGVLEQPSTPVALRTSWRDRLAALFTRVATALGLRRTAELAATEVELDIQRWKERADRTRRAIDGALTTYAAENGLPRDFNDRFFPAAPPRRKAAPVDPAT